jgi:hypothetical protein
MARRKRKSKDAPGQTAACRPPSIPARIGIDIEQAENGNVVRLSSDGIGKKHGYSSKTMVAPDQQSAIRIATAHIATMGPKLRKKGSKKAKSKRSMRKA